LVLELVSQQGDFELNSDQTALINRFYQDIGSQQRALPGAALEHAVLSENPETGHFEEHVEIEESLSLDDRERELIQKALEKHRGKRKYAAAELGISERTLYRKIKEYNLTE
jgi:transcriptional regulator with PAS, ATPase and Fis domain